MIDVRDQVHELLTQMIATPGHEALEEAKGQTDDQGGSGLMIFHA